MIEFDWETISTEPDVCGAYGHIPLYIDPEPYAVIVTPSFTRKLPPPRVVKEPERALVNIVTVILVSIVTVF
jgi:hypothetical protein